MEVRRIESREMRSGQDAPRTVGGESEQDALSTVEGKSGQDAPPTIGFLSHIRAGCQSHKRKVCAVVPAGLFGCLIIRLGVKYSTDLNHKTNVWSDSSIIGIDSSQGHIEQISL